MKKLGLVMAASLLLTGCQMAYEEMEIDTGSETNNIIIEYCDEGIGSTNTYDYDINRKTHDIKYSIVHTGSAVDVKPTSETGTVRVKDDEIFNSICELYDAGVMDAERIDTDLYCHSISEVCTKDLDDFVTTKEKEGEEIWKLLDYDIADSDGDEKITYRENVKYTIKLIIDDLEQK